MTSPSHTELVSVDSVPSDELARRGGPANTSQTDVDAPDDRPPIGTWWWVSSIESSQDQSDYDEPDKVWLACVTELGSNYAKVRGVTFSSRIAFGEFHERCKPAGDPGPYIDTKIGVHRDRVRAIMGEIQNVCRQLGVPMRDALAAAAVADPGNALAVAHGVDDVKKHQRALVKAKDKTLPELFKQVSEQHEQMAKWMKAELIPATAELDAAKEVTEVIQHKIHTVELYAGIGEKLVQIRKGAPAASTAKLHLMQRRHYMDEECLLKYEAGGMSFKNIGAFDKWLARDENFRRILPHDRTMVAFRVRRWDRQDDSAATSIEAFISLWYENRESKRTYLYIRNGEQLWRQDTTISFDEELFPKQEDDGWLGADTLWAKSSRYDIEHGGIITGRQRAAMIEKHRRHRQYVARMLWAWHRAGCPERPTFDDLPPGSKVSDTKDKALWPYTAIDHENEQYQWTPGSVHMIDGDPRTMWWSRDYDRDPTKPYSLITPDNLYYDDAMAQVRHLAFQHNRIAVIVQGLLDRSVCLQPHPPWKIFTPQGFAAAIELVFDVSRAITPGEEPDWAGYREQLNKSIRPGAFTIGQRKAWREYMHERHGSKWEHYGTYGDGPEFIAQVVRVNRKTGACEFRWMRSRVKPKWVTHPTRPGYLKATYPQIECKWECPAKYLTCVDAYTPGDFHLFFDDPRTRAQYVRWAPILLSAENWHARRRSATPSKATVVVDDDDMPDASAAPDDDTDTDHDDD